MMVTTPVLDVACGPKMFYFDKDDARVTFCDINPRDTELFSGRRVVVRPDIVADFRSLPFSDSSFDLVVFDPPHLKDRGPRGKFQVIYGHLDRDGWRDDLRQGFAECWRVLRTGGTLVFKWAETDIKLREVLALAPANPLLGNRQPKRSGTHWVLFYKEGGEDGERE